jgi:hypothetical protein
MLDRPGGHLAVQKIVPSVTELRFLEVLRFLTGLTVAPVTRPVRGLPVNLTGVEKLHLVHVDQVLFPLPIVNITVEDDGGLVEQPFAAPEQGNDRATTGREVGNVESDYPEKSMWSTPLGCQAYDSACQGAGVAPQALSFGKRVSGARAVLNRKGK